MSDHPASGRPVVQLFFNPASGGYSDRRIRQLARALEDEGAQVLTTPSTSGLPRIAPHATHIAVAGGDGTIRHVAQALAEGGTALPVGAWPAGTVNLIAREAGATRSPRQFAQGLLHGQAVQPHYLARMGDTVFLACASLGPDSHAVARLKPALKRRIGRLAYAAAFLGVLKAWPRPALRILADGADHACEAVYVAKGRYFAGPWTFAPGARVSDGLLHVVALRRARRRDFAVLVWDMMRGRDPARRANVIALTCTDLAITGEAGVPVQADGDVVAASPVRLAIQPEPLAFH